MKDKYKSFTFLGTRILSFHITEGAGWFRIFGFGLKWKDSNKYMLLFSERNGYTKIYKIGKYWIGFLKPALYNWKNEN
jgi:hypothetical protein